MMEIQMLLLRIQSVVGVDEKGCDNGIVLKHSKDHWEPRRMEAMSFQIRVDLSNE